MNKKDFIDLVSEKTNLTKKDVKLVIDTFLDDVCYCLAKGDKVVLSNFGVLDVNKVATRDIFSPYDGKTLKAVESFRIHFRSSDYLKEKVKNGTVPLSQ